MQIAAYSRHTHTHTHTYTIDLRNKSRPVGVSINIKSRLCVSQHDKLFNTTLVLHFQSGPAIRRKRYLPRSARRYCRTRFAIDNVPGRLRGDDAAVFKLHSHRCSRTRKIKRNHSRCLVAGLAGRPCGRAQRRINSFPTARYVECQPGRARTQCHRRRKGFECRRHCISTSPAPEATARPLVTRAWLWV